MLDRVFPSNPRARSAAFAVVTAVAMVLAVYVLIPALANGRQVPPSVLFRALVLGVSTSLTTAGVILIYRAVRIVNFAQVAIGAAGATLTFQLVRYVHVVPFPVAVLLGLAVAAATGALIDIVMGRRFANAPRLVLTVVSITVAIVLSSSFVAAVTRLPVFPPLKSRPLTDLQGTGSLHDYLPLRGLQFRIGANSTTFGFADLFGLELAIIVLVALAIFLRFTRAGVAVRAVAENADRASLLGISVGGLSTLVWGVSGLLAGASSIATGFVVSPGAAFGVDPAALLIPLAAATVARFASIPKAVGATILLTVLTEAWNFDVVRDINLVSVGLLLILGIGLLLGRRGGFRFEQGASSSWAAAEEVRPIPKEFDPVSSIRIAKYTLLGVLVAGLIAYPFLVSTGAVVLGQSIALGGIVATSLVVLTGWSGQVSLGQYGIVAIGTVVEGGLTARAGVPFIPALVITVVACAALSLVVGLPALRIKGLFLGVVTFAFSIAVTSVVFDRRYFGWILPSSTVGRPAAFFFNFGDERSMYFLCIGAFLSSVVVVANLRRSRLGRLLIGLRDNEANVQSFGVGLVRTKLTAFVISGGLCGFAGAMFVHQLRGVTPQGYGPQDSFVVFTYTVIGGVSSLPGALLGVALYQLQTYFLRGNIILLAFSGVLPLVLLYSAPGGLVSILVGLRDGVLRIVAQRRRMVVPSLFADYDTDALRRRLIPLGEASDAGGLAAIAHDHRYSLVSEVHARRPDAEERESAEAVALTSAGSTHEEATSVGAGQPALVGDGGTGL